MLVESHSWSDKIYQTISDGEIFVAKYNKPEHKQEIATAMTFMIRAYRRTRNYDKAVDMCEDLFEMYQDKDYIWPNMDHLDRALFESYESARIGGFETKANKFLKILNERFPHSQYLIAIDLNETANVYDNERQEYLERENKAK